MKQNYAFVLDTNKEPQSPIHPAKARKLLRDGKAAVYRKYPFTIILKDVGVPSEPCRVKIDPGAKKTGLAVLQGDRVVWAAELEHRKDRIKAGLEKRRAIRRGRRNRNTRYRKPRFLNRTRAKGWLSPSLWHLVETTMTWVSRLKTYAPVQWISVENVRFDMQLIQNPDIQGVEYQQGELWQQEVRQYVFTRSGYACAYCGAKNVPFEIEHVVPRSKGGSNRISNLVTSCRPCNEAKGNMSVDEFLKGKPSILARIKRQLKTPLQDAAAVNSTRWAIWNALQSFGLDVESGTGGRTAWNRKRQGLPKTHWLDAANVGASTPDRLVLATERPLLIKSIGRGTRQVVRVDKFGFPRGKAGRIKRSFGFSAGDHACLDQSKGRYVGHYTGVLAGIRKRGDHDIKTQGGQKITSSWKNFTLIQRADGYSYA